MQGEAKLLLRQMALEFGTLPEPVRARIEAARPEQLERWAERVLSATILDDVLS